jgi:hypothetical protein
MVLTYLRNGPESREWKDALRVVDDLLWSVTVPADSEDRFKLRELAPNLEHRIRSGLTMIGDPDVNITNLLKELAACQQTLLSTAPQRVQTPPPAQKPVPRRALWEDVEVAAPAASADKPREGALSPERKAIVDELQSVKLGTWFEFVDPNTFIRTRVKLSWFSTKTSYYIFVNQAGLQVAVKSLRRLSTEILQGEARIVRLERKPFMTRALETIHGLLLSKAGDEFAPP